MLSRSSPFTARTAKKLALVALATAINASLLLLAEPLTRGLPPPPERWLPLVLVGMLVVFYTVFAVMLFFAPQETHHGQRRLAAVLLESLVAFLIFCGVLLFHMRRIP